MRCEEKLQMSSFRKKRIIFSRFLYTRLLQAREKQRMTYLRERRLPLVKFERVYHQVVETIQKDVSFVSDIYVNGCVSVKI